MLLHYSVVNCLHSLLQILRMQKINSNGISFYPIAVYQIKIDDTMEIALQDDFFYHPDNSTFIKSRISRKKK